MMSSDICEYHMGFTFILLVGIRQSAARFLNEGSSFKQRSDEVFIATSLWSRSRIEVKKDSAPSAVDQFCHKSFDAINTHHLIDAVNRNSPSVQRVYADGTP